VICHNGPHYNILTFFNVSIVLIIFWIILIATASAEYNLSKLKLVLFIKSSRKLSFLALFLLDCRLNENINYKIK
jgi:hypothetical protein